MANVECMQDLVAGLVAAGMSTACVSPGSRSSALTLAFDAHPDIDCRVILDERASAFCALGVAKAQHRPVAVVCTSGTAAMELHAAVVEAGLARVPLIVFTTDRPPELHGVGAPQTATQHALYGSAVREFIAAPVPDAAESTARWFARLGPRAVFRASHAPAGPVHVNIPFREPLVERPPAAVRPRTPVDLHASAPAAIEPDAADALAADLAAAERGLIVCGAGAALDLGLGAAVADLARSLAWPVLADVTSGVRFGTRASDLVLPHADLVARSRDAAAFRPDVVIRVGAWPISKPVGACAETAARNIFVGSGVWSDPGATVTDHVDADPAASLAAIAARLGDMRRRPGSWATMWASADSAVAGVLARDRPDSPMSEPRLAATVVSALPAGAALCIGPSMPLRDVDAFAPRRRSPIRVFANRGANGIDGFVSTANGVALGGPRPTVAVCGDLTLAHDGLALRQTVRENLPVTFVVPDNRGGGIFEFLPQASLDLGAAFERCMVVPDAPRPIDLARSAECETVEVVEPDELAFLIRGAGTRRAPLGIVVPGDARANAAEHERIWAAAEAAVAATVRTFADRTGARVARAETS